MKTYPISYPLGAAWYVLAFFSRAEFMAEKKIREELKFDVYTPRMVINRLVARRRMKTSVPLFPGYGFARFDIDRDDWGKILEIDGVMDILNNLDIPVRIPDQVIDKLRRAEDAGAFDYTKPCSAFSIGDDVEIKEGPFAGLIAKIKSASKKKRVGVVLKFLGQMTVFSVETCDLAKV